MNSVISVIIPVFNEAKTITNILERVNNIPFKKEIIIVDDGSTDDLGSIIRDWQKNNLGSKFISYQKNRGKGFAIREGIKNATGNVVVIQDADLEYHPEEYVSLIKKILNKEAVVVYGTRFNKQNLLSYRWKAYHILGNKLVTFVANKIFSSSLTDMMTCYKAFSIDIVNRLNLTCDGFAIEAEITAEILKTGIKIKEVPITYTPRSYKQGKKINFLNDFFAVIYWLIKKRPHA